MVFAHKSYSVGPLPSDEDANASRDNAEEDGEGGGNAHSGANPLSVMYPPCQDPMLFKIYQNLPTLPCVASFCFCKFCKY